MKTRKFIATTISEYLNESQIEIIKDDIIPVFKNKIEGRFLNKKQAEELQKEIESNYIDDIKQHFNREKQDIRMNLFNYDNPIAEKTINGVNLRIAEGLIRNNRKTYLLYADGKIIGEFYSVKDIKMILKYIEDNLIKSVPSNPRELNEQSQYSDNIEHIVTEIVDEYGDMYNDDPIDINEGNCANFAEDLLERLGGESENTYIIEVQRDLGGYGEWFKDSDGKYKFEKYGKLPNKLILSVNQDIKKFDGKYNRWLNNKGIGIDKFKVGDHYWIYHNGKHYDAETPKGVNNMFELPIFKRYINYFIKMYKN